ncbi:YidH family protein [Bradymonas sediminis]|uniref:DUF202 domain-containing protein n=1 Tax=Bradymonas sediminis TaxID=1548548 RepID=A0A2Z4FGL5_9DELT|nr:DUF202 domain-containing protein [Bradymonas sediminis]AWV88030.1 DUF202 domain-containing protein [Bradymonas sediminis]TDP77153.1 putative membrane protein [Bradymonas sediminis]
MAEKTTTDPAGDSPTETLGEQRTDLAYQRSVEAAERTLMAAVRTAVSMVSFGFTIAKFFQYLSKLGDLQSKQSELDQAPHHLGLVLLVGGVLTIVLGIAEYVIYARDLRRRSGQKRRLSSALFSAVFILVVGLLLSASVVVDLVIK